jgi:dihydrofolate synthase/folylpolyglutamate synthase
MASYKETLNYLYTQLPMFTRVGEAAYKPNLDNTLRLLQALNNPHHNLKCIHIAGTNGKGSTSNMLAAVLQKSGYKTGLYTSPHLLDFRERIRVDGKMISKKYVVDFVARNKNLFEEIKPSFFEMTIGLCFEYFAKKKIDIAVIETGLGGRLDSTNVITPMLSIITNIGLDHTHLLGNTIPKIAVEKAGIIKAGVPVVIGETDAQTKKIFVAKAKAMKSEIIFADKHIMITELKNNNSSIKIKVFDGDQLWFEKLNVSLAGNYQLKNIVTTLQSIKILRRNLKIKDKDIAGGLGDVQGITGFAGRWQLVRKHPTVILDTGHNAHGLKQSLAQLRENRADKLHLIFGVVRDKKLEDIIPLLPENAHYYLCAPNLPRAMPVEELTAFFIKGGFHYLACPSVTDAYKLALHHAKRKDIVFVGGSTFVVAEVMEYLK